MPRKKLRYVIDENGDYREIFSIGEGSLGDLSITLRGADSLSMGDELNKFGRLVLDKVSVHRSLNSVRDGTTISRTITFEDATIIKLSAFIKSSKKRFLWHLFSIACPNLKPPRYNVSTGKTVSIVRLRTDNTPIATLCCHIFVANKNRCWVSSPANFVHTWDFKHFRILTYTNFINLPATHLGGFTFMPTTTLSVNGVKSDKGSEFFENYYPNGAINLEDSDVVPIIYSNNNFLYNKLYDQLKAFMAEHRQR